MFAVSPVALPSCSRNGAASVAQIADAGVVAGVLDEHRARAETAAAASLREPVSLQRPQEARGRRLRQPCLLHDAVERQSLLARHEPDEDPRSAVDRLGAFFHVRHPGATLWHQRGIGVNRKGVLSAVARAVGAVSWHCSERRTGRADALACQRTSPLPLRRAKGEPP